MPFVLPFRCCGRVRSPRPSFWRCAKKPRWTRTSRSRWTRWVSPPRRRVGRTRRAGRAGRAERSRPVKVADVMSRDVVTAKPDTPFKDVVERMLERNVSGLPVVDDLGRLLGVVTEADLIAKEGYGGRRHRALTLVAAFCAGHDPTWIRRAPGMVAGEIMSCGAATATPHDDAQTAARAMLERHVKRLPVVDDHGKLCGIVSRQDLLRAF